MRPEALSKNKSNNAADRASAGAQQPEATDVRPEIAPEFSTGLGFGIIPRLLFGFSVITALVLGGGVWAGTAKLSGAIIAPGTVVVEQHKKKVQHSEGGIVAKINVRNGDIVKAGDILLTLDDTQLKARIGVMHAQETEFVARSARLKAERNGETQLVFPKAMAVRGDEAKAVTRGERRLFQENVRNIKGKIEQHKSRISQLNSEIKGLNAQFRSKKRERKLVLRELASMQRLKRQKLARAAQLFAKEREATRIEGELGELTAKMARAKGQISEIRLQILAVGQEARSNAQRELRDLEAKLAELRERQIAARDELRRIDLRAPLSGVVHELTVHTVGGVVTPAEQIMLIVPQEDKLIVDVKLPPNDIDQLHIGQPARLRFSAFNQNTTPEINGRVDHIAADVSVDSATGATYYSGRIALKKQMLEKLGGKKVIPGMPVEVFVTTGTRTALSYLTKPFMDHFNRTFQE